MANIRALAALLFIQAVIARPSAGPSVPSRVNVKLDAQAVDWRATSIRPEFDVAGALHAPLATSNVGVLTDERHWHGFAFESYRELLLSYEVYFPVDFSFRAGEDLLLPGIAGRSCSTREERCQTFAIRVAWSGDAGGHVAVQQDRAATSFPSILVPEVPVSFSPGTWTTIGLHATLPEERADAEVELFVNGTLTSRWSVPQLDIRASRWVGVDLSVYSAGSPPAQTVSLSRFAVSGRLARSSASHSSGQWQLWPQLVCLASGRVGPVTGVVLIIIAVFGRRRCRSSRRVMSVKG